MAKNRLNIILGVDVSQLERQLGRAQRKLNRFASRLQSTGRTLTESLTVPLGAVGVAAVSTFAKFDKLEKGLTAIQGSADVAKKTFDDLLAVVKDTRTTLDLKTAVTAQLQLEAVGVAGERATNVIRQLGIAATVSGSSADDLGEVARQLSQAAAKGGILQQELRIILERMPALAKVISEEFGTVTAEGLRDAGVSADQFIARLTAAIEKNEQFQSVQGGLAKAIETFGIELQIAGNELGKTISQVLNLEEVLKKVSDAIAGAVSWFKSLTPEAQKFIVVAGVVAVAIGPVLLIIGKLIAIGPVLVGTIKSIVGALRGLPALFALITSPVTLTIAALVGLGAAIVAANDKFIGFRKVLNGTIDFLVEFFTILKDVIGAVSNIASGLEKFFRRDFAGAAASITAGLQKEIPSVQEIGVRLGAAFAGGFADETNRVDKFVENLKGKIFKQVQDVKQELSTATTPTPGGVPGGGGTGAGSALDETILSTPNVEIDDTALLSIEETSFALTAASKPLADYAAGLAKATEAAALFGATNGDILQEKLSFTKQAIQDLLAEGYTPQSQAIQTLLEEYNALGAQLEEITAKEERLNSQMQFLSDTIGNTVTGAFDSFFTTIEDGGKNALNSFAQGMKKALIQVAKQLAITLVKALAVAAVLTVILPGSNLGKAATFVGRFKDLFAGFGGFGLAEGGIIPPGYPNDTFPARLTSGEAVIPLDRLNQFSGQDRVLEARVSGEDLLILMRRAENSYNRYS